MANIATTKMSSKGQVVIPVTEHQGIYTDIHPFKWLSMKFVS